MGVNVADASTPSNCSTGGDNFGGFSGDLLPGAVRRADLPGLPGLPDVGRRASPAAT